MAFQILKFAAEQALDNAANVLSGATLTFTLTGVSTPTNAYSDSALTIPLANPLSADSAGAFVSIFLDPDIVYKIILKTSAGVVLKTWDPANESPFTTAGLSLLLTRSLIGLKFYPQTAIESAQNVTPTNYFYPSGNILRYGADPTGVSKSTTALINAIKSVGDISVSINSVTTFTGGIVYLPRGTYVIDYSQTGLLITTIGLVLKGEGAQYFNDYKAPATAIIVDGSGSSSTDYVFKASTTENARGFVAEDIAFQYKNGFAGDYFYWGAAGFMLERCSFSATALSPTYPTTCNSFLRMFNGHHYRLHSIVFSDAQWAIIIDNALAANTNDWSILGCNFYDFAAGFIKNTGSGVLGMDIGGCGFDPITINPTDGVVLSIVGGSIHGCTFAGSNNTSCPVNSWLSIDGEVSVTGNVFNYQPGTPSATKAAILVTGGHSHIEANRISCSSGIIASGAACLTGGNNSYNNLTAAGSDIAVRLSQNSGSYTDIGPDNVSSGFVNSYSIGGSGSIAGFVNYSPDVDSSSSGPLFQNVLADGIRIRTVNPKYDTSTTGTLTIKQTGTTFSASGGTYTLPANTLAARGIYYRFIKFSASTVTINAGSGTNIYDGASKASLADSTAGDIGSTITIEYVDSTHAVVIAKTGTWA